MFQALKTLPREARDTLFLLAVIGWTIAPQIDHLPWWCTALALTLLLWRGSIALSNQPLPSRWWLFALLALATGATLATHRTILGRDAGVTFVVVLLALKTLEMRARRDAFVIFFLGFFTLLSNFFYSQSLITALCMLVSLLGLLTALVTNGEGLTAALGKIAAWLGRTPQTDQEAVGRRIGRALGRFPAAAAIIHATVQRDATGRAVDLQIASAVDAGQKAHRQKGAYLLRTNCEETDPAQLWRWYIQLTQAEAAFRTAKSDLGLRPVFHRKEDHVQAHLLVCFLALAMWRSLEQWMRAKGLGTCARQLVQQLAGVKSVDVLPVRRGGARTELRLRVVATPAPATAQLLAYLGLRLPKDPRLIAIVVPKIPAESPHTPAPQQRRSLN